MKKNKKLKKRVLLVIIIAFTLTASLFTALKSPQFAQVRKSYESNKIEKTCSPETNRTFCYAKEFETLTTKTDYKFAYETLTLLQKKDTQAMRCHLVAHTITGTQTG